MLYMSIILIFFSYFKSLSSVENHRRIVKAVQLLWQGSRGAKAQACECV